MTAEEWYQKGLFLLKNPEKHDEVEICLKKAIELAPDSPEPWHGLGNLLSAYPSRHEEAEEAYKTAIDLDEKFPFPWHGLGNLLSNYPGRHKEAEGAYKKAIQLDEKITAFWVDLGFFLSKYPSRHEEAEQAYQTAIQLDENEAAPWNGVGNLLSAYPSRLEEAEQAYQTAIQLDENEAAPWNGMGNLLSDYPSRHGEAEQAYQKAIQLNENYAAPWNGLGNLLSNYPARHKEAEGAYKKAIQLDEKITAFWVDLGFFLSKNYSRHGEAELAYQTAIQLDENDVSSWNGLGNLHSDYPSRHEEAEQAYQTAIQLDENEAAPWNGLGNLHSDYPSRHGEAEQAYQKAIQLNENYAAPWNGLGNLLSDYPSRHEEAEQAYQKAIQLNENYAAPWNGLGNLLSDYPSRHEEAEQAYQKAIQLNENDATPWNGLGNLLSDYPSRHEEAEQAYQTAIQLDENDAYPWIGLVKLNSKKYSNLAQLEIGKLQKVLSISQFRKDRNRAIIGSLEFLSSVVRNTGFPMLKRRFFKELSSANISFMPSSQDSDLSIEELLFFAETSKNNILKSAIYLFGGDAETCFQILDQNESEEDENNYQYQYYMYRSASQYYNTIEAAAVLKSVFINFEKIFSDKEQAYYASLLLLEYFEVFGEIEKIDSAIEIIEGISNYQSQLHIKLLHLVLLTIKNPEDDMNWGNVADFLIKEDKVGFFKKYISPVHIDNDNYNLFLHAKELSLYVYKLQRKNRVDEYKKVEWQSGGQLARLFDEIESASPFTTWLISPIAQDGLTIKKKKTIESWLEEIESRLEKDVSLSPLLNYPKEEITPKLLASKIEDLIVSEKVLTNFLHLIDYFKLKGYYSEKERNLLNIYSRICLHRRLVLTMSQGMVRSIVGMISTSVCLIPDILDYIGFFDDTWNEPMSDKIYDYLRKKMENKSLGQVTYFSLKNEIEAD